MKKSRDREKKRGKGEGGDRRAEGAGAGAEEGEREVKTIYISLSSLFRTCLRCWGMSLRCARSRILVSGTEAVNSWEKAGRRHWSMRATVREETSSSGCPITHSRERKMSLDCSAWWLGR
jgi:hypothetical protein